MATPWAVTAATASAGSRRRERRATTTISAARRTSAMVRACAAGRAPRVGMGSSMLPVASNATTGIPKMVTAVAARAISSPQALRVTTETPARQAIYAMAQGSVSEGALHAATALWMRLAGSSATTGTPRTVTAAAARAASTSSEPLVMTAIPALRPISVTVRVFASAAARPAVTAFWMLLAGSSATTGTPRTVTAAAARAASTSSEPLVMTAIPALRPISVTVRVFASAAARPAVTAFWMLLAGSSATTGTPRTVTAAAAHASSKPPGALAMTAIAARLTILAAAAASASAAALLAVTAFWMPLVGSSATTATPWAATAAARPASSKLPGRHVTTETCARRLTDAMIPGCAWAPGLPAAMARFSRFAGSSATTAIRQMVTVATAPASSI